MSDINLVIFDCDGTLMDTELIAAAAETELLAEYGIEISLKEFTNRFAGTSSSYVFKTLEDEYGRSFPDDHLEKLKLKMHEKLWREAKSIDGAHEMLDVLDYPRCICSNAGTEKLKIELSRAKLWDRFRPYVYSATDLDGCNIKPAPDIFLHAAQDFEVDASTCVVVEDSKSGVAGGLAADMRVIGFAGGSHTYPSHADDLIDAGAETVVRRLADIPATIEAFKLWDGLNG